MLPRGWVVIFPSCLGILSLDRDLAPFAFGIDFSVLEGEVTEITSLWTKTWQGRLDQSRVKFRPIDRERLT